MLWTTTIGCDKIVQKSKKVGKGNNTNNNYADKLEIYSFTGQETALETVQEVKIQLMVVNQGIRMEKVYGNSIGY